MVDFVLPDKDTHFLKYQRKGRYQRAHVLAGMAASPRWHVAIDIGAHVGFSSWDMHHFYKEVHAFEPEPENFKCLSQNVPVIAHQIAIGKAGRAGLKNPCIENSGAWELVEGDTVDVVPLDKFGFTGVGFIKIDVQGKEVEVLESAKETLMENKPSILIECSVNHRMNKSIVRYLKGLGASPLVVINEDAVFTWT